VKLSGAAWAGDLTVRRVDVSTDFGATWKQAQLSAHKNPYDWQRWTATVKLPNEGYYEIWTRATDSRGVMQPHVAGNWNPQGYGANPMHRVAIRIA
jgi:sulfite oxidase